MQDKSSLTFGILEAFKKNPVFWLGAATGLVCFGLYAYKYGIFPDEDEELYLTAINNKGILLGNECSNNTIMQNVNNSGNMNLGTNYGNMAIGGDIIIKTAALSKESLNETWNIPPENKNFTGRSGLLNDIKEHFEKNHDQLALIACHGLGGIGKTQLALKFAWENCKSYKGVCWFSAESAETLIIDYIAFGNELNLFNDDNLSLAERAKLVKTWLENHSGWLLIYDNVSSYEDIVNLLPAKGGKILITSRHTNFTGTKISVDVFSEKEAKDYVEKITGIKNEPEDINALIKLLGRLPLALAQACAYIKRHNKKIKAYLGLYQKSHEELLKNKLLPEGENHVPVAITWQLTLDKMQKESQESVELLYFCSQLHNENIPMALLEYFFSREIISENNLEMKIDEAKRLATEYSMIIINSEKQSFAVHCLVQEVIRNQLHKEGKLLNYLQSGIAALLEAYPYGKDKNEDIQLKRELLPHLEIMLKNRDEHSEKMKLPRGKPRGI